MTKKGEKVDKKFQRVNIERLKAKVLEYYRELPVFELAAHSVGRDRSTLWRWRNEDPAFEASLQKAGATWAKRKTKGVKSKEWLLERVMKSHFSPRSEVTGADGGVLKIDIVEDTALKTDSKTDTKDG